MATWLNGGEEPESVKGFSFESAALYEVTPKQRALYRGVISLTLSQHTRDFHNVKPMNRSLIETENVDDHHIFPDAWLKANGEKEAKRRDCILNRTLIDRLTNQSLSKRDPNDYFSEIKTKLGETKFLELAASHLLPAGIDSPLWSNQYEEFIGQRCELIHNLIESVTTV